MHYLVVPCQHLLNPSHEVRFEFACARLGGMVEVCTSVDAPTTFPLVLCLLRCVFVGGGPCFVRLYAEWIGRKGDARKRKTICNMA